MYETLLLFDDRSIWSTLTIFGATSMGPSGYRNMKKNLQLRLSIVAHNSAACHRGRDDTEMALQHHFVWKTLPNDEKAFVSSCIHCLSTTGSRWVLRPLCPSVNGNKPNGLIQFDYLELGQSSNRDKYVLKIRDDHSGYSCFFPFSNTNAENAAHAILDWCAALGTPRGLISDGSPQFRNEAARLVTKSFAISASIFLALLLMDQSHRRTPRPRSTLRCVCHSVRAQATPESMAGSDTALSVCHQLIAISTAQKYFPNHGLFRPQTHSVHLVLHLLRHAPPRHFV